MTSFDCTNSVDIVLTQVHMVTCEDITRFGLKFWLSFIEDEAYFWRKTTIRFVKDNLEDQIALDQLFQDLEV